LVGIEDLYLLNLAITTILLLATLYRVKIERDIAKVTIENAVYRNALKRLKRILESEKDVIETADGKEVYEFLKEFLKDEIN